MARTIQLKAVKNFAGGLNLRSDPYELAENESPDLLNVDIDPRGGIEQRRGITELPMTVSNPNLLTVDESTAETSGASMFNLTRGDFSTWYFMIYGVGNGWLMGAGTGTVEARVERFIPVSPSTSYTASAYVRASAVRSFTVNIRWYDSGGALISTSTSPAVNTGSSLAYGGVKLGVTATSPVNAATSQVVVVTTNATSADTLILGALYFAKGRINAGGYLRPETTSSFDYEPQTILKFEKTGVTQTLVMTMASVWLNASGDLRSWEQIAFTASSTTYGTVTGVQFKGALYIFFPYDNVRKWDGTNLTIITGQAYVDDLAAPSGSNMVLAKTAAVFQGSFWIANTNESAMPAATPNRVRWSHPNNPEVWRSFDYIDVDIDRDGDEITALVPFRDRLLIFKQRSIYAIVGTGPENFSVYPVAQVGAVSPHAVVTTPSGVYFFSWPDGIFLYDGQLTWQFSRLRYAIEGSLIPADSRGNIRLMWSGRRLWLALEYRADPKVPITGVNNRCFIMDPALSKEGSWTTYSLSVGTMRQFAYATGPNLLIGAISGRNYIQVLENPDNYVTYDLMVNGSQRHISSYYTTSWFDLGSSTIKKRFRAPEFVLRTVDIVTSLLVEAKIDFADAYVKKSFNLYTKQDPNVLIWTSGTWGQSWQIRTIRQSEITKGSPLGIARAVSLKIYGPTTNDHWGINALTLKYVPRPPR